MPVRTKPKPPGQAVNRHPRLEFVEVPNTPQKARPLPARRDGERWPDGMAGKWRAWSRMPHTILWTDTDWEFAIDTLHVAARSMENGTEKCFVELRMRERIMGTTVDARRDLRIRYSNPPEPETDPAAVTRLDDYRAL